MKFSVRKVIVGTGVGLMLAGGVFPAISTIVKNNEVQATSSTEEDNQEVIELKLVDTVEEVLASSNNNGITTMTSNVNRNELSNNEAQELVKELRSFASSTGSLSSVLAFIPGLGRLFSAGIIFTTYQANSMADEIEENNIGYGVTFVTNLDTGVYSIQRNTAGPRPW